MMSPVDYHDRIQPDGTSRLTLCPPNGAKPGQARVKPTSVVGLAVAIFSRSTVIANAVGSDR
jgi:hypothetical protein